MNPPSQPSQTLVRYGVVRSFLGLAGCFASLLILNFLLRPIFSFEPFSRHGLVLLREFLLAYGAFTPLVFVGLYALRAFIYLPEPLLMIVAGFLFGTILGTVLVLYGSLIAAALAYGTARLLSRAGMRRLFRRIFRPRTDLVETLKRRYGFRTLVLLRMLPVFPFTLVTYSAGFLRLPFGRFLLALCSVVVPALLYASCGDWIIAWLPE